MKRYKAQIFSALMSICVATTFVGYNFTISNALETNFVDENGNKIANAQVVKYNEKATKPEGLEKEGYDLSWELNDKVYDFNESVTDNITLKAKYTPKKYEVKFQDNFGNTIAHTVEVNHNETVTEPEAEKKEYYSFKEWQLDGKKYDFSNKIVKPLTLVGEYEKPIGYYVCFIQNEQLHDSRNFTDITKDINAKSKVDKSVLDALYGFDTKNVKGRTKDISEVSDLSNILGDSEEALNERATKIFKSRKERPAWLDKEDYEVKMYRLVIEKDGLHVDMKLIGKDGQEIKPPAKTYTVQFKDDEGNTLSNSQTVKENEKANEPEAPAKEGYKFIGWQLNESKYDFSSPVTQDIVLVAKFEKEQGDNPGNNQGDNPGNNQGDNPGNNQGNNQGNNPGNNQGDNPGNNTVGRQPGQSSSGRNRDNNSSSPRTVTPIVTVNDDVVPLSTPNNNNNNNTSNETVEEETTPLAVPKDDNTNETMLEEETTPLAAPDKSIDETKEIAEDAVPLSLPKTGNQDNMLYVLLGMAMSIFGIKKFRK